MTFNRSGGEVSGEVKLSPTITEVNVQPVNEDRLKAFVTVVFEDNFVVHGVKIIRAGGRTFVAMPTRRSPKGQQSDVCHPINRTYRRYLEETIIRAYERKLEDLAFDPGRESERSPAGDDGGMRYYPPH
jgi:stage V sporulation protein G